MSRKGDVRAGYSKARLNENAAVFFVVEAVVLSLLAGIATESWLIGGGSFFFFGLIPHIPIVSSIVIGILGIGGGAIGWQLGLLFNDTQAQIVLAIIGFALVAGVNSFAMEYLRDVG